MRASKGKSKQFSWVNAKKRLDEYIDPEYFPDNFELKEPSRINMAEVTAMMDHWNKRRDAGQIVLMMKKWSPSNCPDVLHDATYAPRTAEDVGDSSDGKPSRRRKKAGPATGGKNPRKDRKGKGKAKSAETVDEDEQEEIDIDQDLNSGDGDGGSQEESQDEEQAETQNRRRPAGKTVTTVHPDSPAAVGPSKVERASFLDSLDRSPDFKKLLMHYEALQVNHSLLHVVLCLHCSHFSVPGTGGVHTGRLPRHGVGHLGLSVQTRSKHGPL